MTVSIVVPIVTTCCLRSFFDSLYRQGLEDAPPTEVIILDNRGEGEPLGLGDFVQTVVVEHDPPVPFHAAWNAGVCLAAGDYIIIVNDDVVWGQRSVLNLVDALRTFDLFCVYPSPGNEATLRGSKTCDLPQLIGPPEFRGWCHAWTHEGLQLVGPFDERFELFYGDDDAWMRLINLGRPARQVHNAMLHHLESQSVQRLDPRYVREAKERDAQRFRVKWDGKTGQTFLREKGLGG